MNVLSWATSSLTTVLDFNQVRVSARMSAMHYRYAYAHFVISTHAHTFAYKRARTTCTV
jgi:hypothetical protein